MIKDLEDLEGDKKIQAKTLAITYGIEKTKWVSLIFTIFTFLGIAYFQYFQLWPDTFQRLTYSFRIHQSLF